MERDWPRRDNFRPNAPLCVSPSKMSQQRRQVRASGNVKKQKKQKTGLSEQKQASDRLKRDGCTMASGGECGGKIGESPRARQLSRQSAASGRPEFERNCLETVGRGCGFEPSLPDLFSFLLPMTPIVREFAFAMAHLVHSQFGLVC